MLAELATVAGRPVVRFPAVYVRVLNRLGLTGDPALGRMFALLPDIAPPTGSAPSLGAREFATAMTKGPEWSHDRDTRAGEAQADPCHTAARFGVLR